MPETKDRELTFGEAVKEAIAEEMRRDSRVFLIGEDVAEAGTPFKVLSGLVEVTALLPVSAVDLAGTALRLDGLATDLAKAAQALREVIDDGR